jgi:hypothetical protein
MNEMSSDRLERDRTWRLANQAYLLAQVQRVRLLLHRRVLWLRQCWSSDPLQPSAGLVVSDVRADGLLAGEDLDGEAKFFREDAEAGRLTDELATLVAALDRRRRELADAGAPAALDTLGYLLHLTAFEKDVLLLCLAAELDSGIERLYAYVQDDAQRCYPTLQLACALLGTPAMSGRASLTPTAPLRRFHLVTLAPGAQAGATPSSRPLRLDERVGAYLLGLDPAEERLDDLLRPVPSAPLTARQRALVDRVARCAGTGAVEAGRPVVNLVGPTAVTAAVARALADRLGVRLYRLDPARLPPTAPDRRMSVQLLEREAVLAQFAVYLDAADGEADLVGLMEQLDLPVLLIGSPEQRATGRPAVVVHVPRPGPDGQRELWRLALSGRDGQVGETAIDAVVHQFDLDPREIVEAVAAAAGRAGPGAASGRIDGEDLWQACREHSGLRLDDLARRIQPRNGWDDIVLPADGLAQLREIADQVAHRPRVYEAWGFGRRLGPSRGISALFAGPSGTGKSMAAEVLAGALRLDLYRVDLSGVVSKYIGETEKNLRRVFDAAERSGAVLCFDEADALFGKRSEVKDSHDRYANIEVDYLLQRMDDYRGLAILTTNRKAALDRAFLRRLRFLVEFPFPDADLRRRIWQRSFPPEAPVGDLDWGALVRLEIAGGNIRNIAVNAAFLAARDGTEIGLAHVMHAARREYAKTDKLMDAAGFGPAVELVPA